MYKKNKKEIRLMASINGIKITSLTTFRGHEGEPLYQGNISYKGKKLGFWSQDAHGAICDNFDFDESVLNEEVEKYKKSDRVEEKYRKFTDISSLLADLAEIMEREKVYKKGAKKGYKSYVMTSDGYHICGYYTNTPVERIESESFHKDFMKTCKDKFFKDWKEEVTIYSDLKDFDIVV